MVHQVCNLLSAVGRVGGGGGEYVFNNIAVDVFGGRLCYFHFPTFADGYFLLLISRWLE